MSFFLYEKLANEILAEITGINYKTYLVNILNEFPLQSFNINTCPATCNVYLKKGRYAISKWVSPKRTRSYPFERIYNSLSSPKKITVIPLVKDEGENGDRDFIQWDTISLMSLLDVYVIPAYYKNAEKNVRLKGKITNQTFDNKYVKDKIKEISNYHSSALHWNLNEIKNNIPGLLNKTIKLYNKISLDTGVKLHNDIGLERFGRDLLEDVNKFMNTSRKKAKKAQGREIMTRQPKEILTTLSKSRITIKNYLGGYYYFTVDEIKVEKKIIYLIEGKHSTNLKLPSISDIKDGLLKMILYCNLSSLTYNGISYKHIPVLSLTSTMINGGINSNDNDKKIIDFANRNKFNSIQITTLKKLFKEANNNNFVVTVKHAHNDKKSIKISRR